MPTTQWTRQDYHLPVNPSHNRPSYDKPLEAIPLYEVNHVEPVKPTPVYRIMPITNGNLMLAICDTGNMFDEFCLI